MNSNGPKNVLFFSKNCSKVRCVFFSNKKLEIYRNIQTFSYLKINKSDYDKKKKLIKERYTFSTTSIKNGIKNQKDFSYLSNYSNHDLFSFFFIGLVSLNKFLLNFCIKIFPYVPLNIIKNLIYNIYCGGENCAEVKKTGLKLLDSNITNMMISYTVEACNGEKIFVSDEVIQKETINSIKEILYDHIVNVIETSGKDINNISPGYLALKPTGLSQTSYIFFKNYKDSKYSKKFDEYVELVSDIVQKIYDINIELKQKFPKRISPFIVATIDAEKHELQESVYELQRRLYAKFNKPNLPITVVGTLQMYLSQSFELLKKEEMLAKKNNYRIGLKMVRGAYMFTEPERDTIIHKTKSETDASYNKGVSYYVNSMLKSNDNSSTFGHLVVASHNNESLEIVSKILNSSDSINKSNIVLAQLLGMGDNTLNEMSQKYKVSNFINYVPWGPPIETKKYLLRRLEENNDAIRRNVGFLLAKNALSILLKKIFRS